MKEEPRRPTEENGAAQGLAAPGAGGTQGQNSEAGPFDRCRERGRKLRGRSDGGGEIRSREGDAAPVGTCPPWLRG